MKKCYSLFLLCFFVSNWGFAQVLTVQPSDPSSEDVITITFDATQGNGELAGYTGDVYAYTGVLTPDSNQDSDWFYVVSDWGQNLPALKMTSLGNDLYELTFQISDLYGLPGGQQVVALAFVFRSADSELVGREADGSDIIYLINKYRPNSYTDHNVFESVLEIFADQGLIHIRAFDEEIFKVVVFPDGQPGPTPSYSVVLEQQAVPTSFEEGADYLLYSTNKVSVLIHKNPQQLAFIQDGDTLAQEFPGFTAYGGSRKQYEFQLQPEEAIYGTGSRAIDVDLRGRELEVYNSAFYGYEHGADLLNICAPFVVSNRGYGLFLDNSWKANFDIGATNPEVLRYTTYGGALPYYFIGGGSMERVLEKYTLLTGRQPLPPRWALGYIQSKFGYQNQSEAEAAVANLLNNDFPLDALVLDLYWFGDPSTMGNLNWDSNRFPDPVGMIDAFQDQGVQTILITEPYFTTQSDNFDFLANQGWLGTNPDGDPYVLDNFWAGPAGLLDLTNPDAIDWIWDFYDARNQEGVAGWWSDLGEPELHPYDLQFANTARAIELHNVYSMLWAKLLHEKHQADYPDRRLFNLIRSGYSGLQRYSAFPWSGDVSSNFSGLRAQVPIMINAGLSGFGYMGSDLGGFVGGTVNDDLFVRWMQLGVFSPVMRVHGLGDDTDLTAYSPATQSIVRDLIQLRYDLLPYIYSLSYENTTKGTPLVRPTNFDEPDNPDLKNINDQYFFGPNILVAPGLYPGQTERMVWLPQEPRYWFNPAAGSWQDAQNQPTITASLPISEALYFIPNGGMVPKRYGLQNTTAYSTDTLWMDLAVSFGAIERSFTLYDDDGTSASALADGAFATIQFQLTSDFPEQLQLEIVPTGNFPGQPTTRELYLSFYLPASFSNNKVFQDGVELGQYSNVAQYENGGPGHYVAEAADFVRNDVHIQLGQETTIITIDADVAGTKTIAASSGPSFLLYPISPNPTTEELALNFAIAEAQALTLSLSGTEGLVHRRETTDRLA
ncbi:MAG: DUF4968 domain-containing protein, partial [Phaeodactylibacter sp.]|nr:DUF4968 domain-containing protein [Phaeodactylibacter sp.]